MVIIVGLGFIVLLEIALTGALLWAYFQLDEWQPILKRQLNGYLALIQEKRALLTSVEETLRGARQGQAKAMGKWSMIAKVSVGLVEKLAGIAKHA